MNTKKIAAAPAVLKALATGIDRLEDGDLSDIAAADEARKILAEAGYIASNGCVYPKEQATNGYVKREGENFSTFRMLDGWYGDVREGERLYLDEACTVFLRYTDAA